MSAGPTPYAEELAKQGLQHQEILEAVAIAAFGFQQAAYGVFRQPSPTSLAPGAGAPTEPNAR